MASTFVKTRAGRGPLVPWPEEANTGMNYWTESMERIPVVSNAFYHHAPHMPRQPYKNLTKLPGNYLTVAP